MQKHRVSEKAAYHMSPKRQNRIQFDKGTDKGTHAQEQDGTVLAISHQVVGLNPVVSKSSIWGSPANLICNHRGESSGG